MRSVSYTHLRAHETRHDLVCRLLLEKKKLQQHFFIFFDADGISGVVGGVLLAARLPADPWRREY